MRRNNPLLKKEIMICRCEKPFIYDLLDQLKDIYEKYPDLETTKVLNKDETGFLVDPILVKL